jgi:hypothetical protein
MRRSAIIIGILAVVAGCDKAKGKPEDLPPRPTFDVATKPPLVFQAFGTRDSTRLVPIAVVLNGQLKPIVLPAADWRRLDSLYFAAGTEYQVYRDAQLAGTVKVTRRMWERDSEPLYDLPGCRDVMPMAAVTLTTSVPLDPAFEFLALSTPPPPVAANRTPPRDVAATARAMALVALHSVQLDTADIDTTWFNAKALHTSVSGNPTILASQVDANAGDEGPGAGHTTHFLVLADDLDGKGYVPTYMHVVSGEARTVEFQRLLDHLDVTGDGTEEVFLESWRYASDNDLVVLSRANGKWHETMRVKQNWCVRKK